MQRTKQQATGESNKRAHDTASSPRPSRPAAHPAHRTRQLHRDVARCVAVQRWVISQQQRERDVCRAVALVVVVVPVPAAIRPAAVALAAVALAAVALAAVALAAVALAALLILVAPLTRAFVPRLVVGPALLPLALIPLALLSLLFHLLLLLLLLLLLPVTARPHRRPLLRLGRPLRGLRCRAWATRARARMCDRRCWPLGWLLLGPPPRTAQEALRASGKRVSASRAWTRALRKESTCRPAGRRGRRPERRSAPASITRCPWARDALLRAGYVGRGTCFVKTRKTQKTKSQI